MTDFVNKVREEAKFLETLLQGLGFYLHARRSIEDSLDRTTDAIYNVVECYYIMLNNMTVGSCSVYLTVRNVMLFSSSINTKFIPKEMINPLILLGYRKDGDNWLEYEVEIT